MLFVFLQKLYTSLPYQYYQHLYTFYEYLLSIHVYLKIHLILLYLDDHLFFEYYNNDIVTLFAQSYLNK